MKIKFEDVRIGDTLLMAKGGILTTIYIKGITKAGSFKYTYRKPNWRDEDRDYNDGMEGDIEKHDTIRYMQKVNMSRYQPYFWLLNRLEDNG